VVVAAVAAEALVARNAVVAVVDLAAAFMSAGWTPLNLEIPKQSRWVRAARAGQTLQMTPMELLEPTVATAILARGKPIAEMVAVQEHPLEEARGARQLRSPHLSTIQFLT
jgi:hypothetical protein